MRFNTSQILLAKKAARDFGIKDISRFSYGKLDNFNDAYYWTLVNLIENKGIKKLAYPNVSDGLPVQSEYDIKKWLDIVHSIYNDSREKNKSVLDLVDEYSNKLDKDTQEDTNFKLWFKFYYNGENLKYASKDSDMEKKALFTGGLGQTTGNYLHSTYDLPGTSFIGSNTKDDTSKDIEKTMSNDDQLKVWKRRVSTACRRIDKLLREDDHLSPDEFFELSQLLLNFSHKVMGVKLLSTANDLTYQFTNSIKKYSKDKKSNNLIKTASDILIKTAQEVEAPPATEAPVAAAGTSTEQAPVATAPAAETPLEEKTPEQTLKDNIPSPDDVEPVDIKDITPIPGPKKGEYDQFMGDIKIDDAASKLDEVAGMLSDRRIIRLLAEFDIMLDKIGIAAMFPELAEAQSKLIDGYSYALTRVTKMMGQLANARMLLQAQDGGEVLNEEQSVDAEPKVPSQSPESENAE